MTYIHKHRAGFLMLEIVVSLALFLGICTMYAYMQAQLNISRARSLDYYQAVTVAHRLIHEIRLGRRGMGAYQYAQQTATCSPYLYVVPIDGSVVQCAHIHISWPEKNAGVHRSFELVACIS